MTALRPDLRARLDALLCDVAPTADVPLDRVGEAIGALAVTTDEIDAALRYIEATGRAVSAPPGAASADLFRVITAARTLAARTGRRARVDEIAAESGLAPDAVRAALLLARVMGR